MEPAIAQHKNGRKDASLSFVVDDYLDDLEIERSAIIMRLRQIDKRLIANGRLKRTHYPGNYVDKRSR